MPLTSVVVVALAAPLRVTVVPLPAGITVPEIVAVAEMVTVPVIPAWVAEITDWPTPAATATAPVPTLTTAGLDDTQLAELVRFCVVPSLKVPVAVSVSVEPIASDDLGALTVMDCSVPVTAVTVNAKTFEVMPFWAAVMLLEPKATPVARPAPLTVATAGLEEVHATELVKFCVLPSLKVPTALN